MAGGLRGHGAGHCRCSARQLRQCSHVLEHRRQQLLGIRASGKLTVDDYDRVLTPRLDAAVREFGIVRALFYMDRDFEGWAPSAAWANTKLDVQHRRDLEKVAIVGAPGWEQWCVRFAGLLMKGELRTFRADSLQVAWNWIKC